MLTYSAIWGSSVTVANNTAAQLINNGGNLTAINSGQQGIAAVGGAVFGTASGGLGIWSSSMEQSAAANIAQLEAQMAFTRNVGPYLDMSQEEIGVALLQAQANINQAELLSLLQTGSFFALDQGLDLTEDYTEEQLMEALNLKLPCN